MTELNTQLHQQALPLEGFCPQRDLAYWVRMVEQDAVAKRVINSTPFARLKKVSFLGAIDHLNLTQKMHKASRSRAVHSLQVAGLAAFVAEHRGYSADLKKHVILAGLLHDIGHPPLSHSVEPYLKQSFGYGHHEMGEKLLDGDHATSKGLHKLLMSNVDITFIKQLIAGEACDEDGGDLFSSLINIDTIEGITRSFRYVKDSSTNLNPVDVAYASFVDKGEQRFKSLDKFWQLKDYVYNNIINKDLGVMADYYSQHFFHKKSNLLSENELFDTELDWERKYHPLFLTLGNMCGNADLPADLVDTDINFTKRKYFIDSGKKNSERYQYKKTKSSTRFEFPALKHTNQTGFLFI